MTHLEESLLPESAPLAWRLAPDHCGKEPASGESCAWIHGFWQYLRLLGLASTPSLHVTFFSEALARPGRGVQAPRVLISGAADYSMLALVSGAYRGLDVRPDITIVDRCETPLMLNRWFAERAAIRVTTRQSDILDYSEAQPFDVVCTHSFLSEFPRDRWPALLAKWRDLLHPGGIAVTINRVRPGGGSAAVGFTPEQSDELLAAIQDRLAALPAAARLDPALLAQAAVTYAARRRTWAPQSREQILTLFEDAGFRMDSLVVGPISGGNPPRISGPTTPGNADYARIVASRQ